MSTSIEVTIGPVLAAGGDGIGHLDDGRVVFVTGALPGERVAIEVVEERRDFARGRLNDVLVAAAARVVPPCPWVAAGCGGCGLQHLDPSAQMRLKQDIVVDALRRIAHIDAAPFLRTPHPVGSSGYRTTVTMSLDATGRPCYHRRRGQQLIAVSDCGVAHPLLRELIDAVSFEPPIQPSTPGSGAGASVTLRVGTTGGERLVVLDADQERRRRRPRVGSGVVSSSGRSLTTDVRRLRVPPDVVIVRPGENAWYNEEVCGRRWRVSARSFFQSGPAAAEAIAEAVDDAVGRLDSGARIVDLYAGVGLLGGTVASRREGVTLNAVEVDAGAAADAAFNLRDLPARVWTNEVGEWRIEQADVVIADPARPGLGRPGVGTVVASGARRVVLVACDPASFGRDTALLAEAGYGLVALSLVEAFPHTPHVEVVARFDAVAGRDSRPAGS